MTSPVRFTELAGWTPQPYRSVFVWVAFEERLVATGERYGPDDHAGVWTADGFLSRWSSRLVDRGWEWMAPLIRRLADGEDPEHVRTDALHEYAARHDGAEPNVTIWNLGVDRLR
ncbi:hypothetical protein ABC304_00530 [Microbacterium sp. 1P10UB]|jgi:hypothetical protein|uniref:hypothetical protein n=1 Tax=unclassified Microbacterium TaxID=2609290 RepID=UPI000C618EE3|nr:hypothetical protein [Microbacterium sp. LRZ72]MAT19487.1 hypothetical protein [Leifsonia sp.]MDX2376198.1 hypothetical protein [Microbacterium sp. LRZ72]|tara:strand:- start:1081 stop:1425 length:345 start_codon:yes stop_codon:yes gene_type:complete